MKSEETIEKDQNSRCRGEEKKKSIKTGSILLLFAVVVLLATTGDWPFGFIASPPSRVNLRRQERVGGISARQERGGDTKELNRIIDESRLNISMNLTQSSGTARLT